MKNEKLYDAISDIREEFIEEAEHYTFKKKAGLRLVKWGSLAACFCLVVLGASVAMSGAFAKKSDVDDFNGSFAGPTPAPGEHVRTVLAYNGALYNVSNELNVLNVAGIPDIMTAEDCGLSLGNLAKTEQGYEETAMETDIELYQYAPAYSNTAVYVIRDGEDYMAGLFSNNLSVDDEVYSPVSELLRRYGVESAEHIRSVAFSSPEVVNSDQTEAMEKEITEQSEIRSFYDAMLSMESECYDREAYLDILLEEHPEALADSSLHPAKNICITTAEGLKFYLNWAKENGWVFSSGAASYYKITEEMQNWLDLYAP